MVKGYGIRESDISEEKAASQSLVASMEGFHIDGKTLSYMTVHPKPEHAVNWMWSTLGFPSDEKATLTKAWLERCASEWPFQS